MHLYLTNTCPFVFLKIILPDAGFVGYIFFKLFYPLYRIDFQIACDRLINRIYSFYNYKNI